jgi:hypothetical protein
MQALRERLTVKPEDLRRRLDPATLPFQTTAEVAPVETTIGQPPAAEAIAFALEVGARGFHLYAAGSPGTGRESTVQWLARISKGPEAVPTGAPSGMESKATSSAWALRRSARARSCYSPRPRIPPAITGVRCAGAIRPAMRLPGRGCSAMLLRFGAGAIVLGSSYRRVLLSKLRSERDQPDPGG